MKIRLSNPELTCTRLEAELGLARGDIQTVNISADGTVEVEAGVILTGAQTAKLQELTGRTAQEVTE